MEDNKKPSVPDNPFLAPDFKYMIEALTDYVSLHQGEKGYILTESSNPDKTIKGFTYNPDNGKTGEARIKAIRVKDGNLQAFFDLPDHVYRSNKRNGSDSWTDIRHKDPLYYIHTILSIAKSIRQYAEQDDIPVNSQIDALKRRLEGINGLMSNLKALNHQAVGEMERLLSREALERYPFPPLTKVRVQYRSPESFSTRSAVCYLDYPKSSGFGKPYYPSFRKTRPDGTISNQQETRFVWRQVLKIERYDKD